MQLGGEKEMIEQAQVGALAMARVSVGVMGPIIPELNVFNLPYVFRSVDQMHKVIDGEIGAELLAKVSASPARLVALGWMDGGSRSLYTKKPVRTPADMKGLRVRCLPSRIHQRTHELLGAVACVMDLKPGIEAIKSGECTAQENPLANTVDYGVHKLHRHHTLTGHMYLSRGIFVHRPAMEAFPGEIQQVLVEAVRAAVLAQREFAEKEDGIARKAIEAAGGEIVEPTADERAAWVRAVQPLHEEARSRFRDGFSLLGA